MRNPTGTATPIPILLEVGRLEDAAKCFALGPELGVGNSVVAETFAAGNECTDLVSVEPLTVAEFTAMLDSVLVVAELITKLAEVMVVNALGLSNGLAMTVPPASSTKTEVGLFDGALDMITAAEGTSEGSSVPHVLQLLESSLATLH